MDIQETIIGAKVVIESLIKLLENENVDISSIEFTIGNTENGSKSKSLSFQNLVEITLEGLDQVKAQKVAVPETPKHQGGYYIRDLRRQSGNSMRFWYQAGYGTKHKNFFWCSTLEEAKKYQDGCDWFEIWHAPYIDSLVEYTVDFQLADRSVGFVDLKAQEQVG